MILENVHAKTQGKKRSSGWPKARKAWLKKYPKCALCGGGVRITVHHIRPFHVHPEFELDPTNFITLCENPKFNCHFAIGHFKNFAKKFNPDIIRDANYFRPKFLSKQATKQV